MIKIKLKDLLKEYSLSISEFSDETGLARSTITPLVNKPNEVKAIKIETLNILCDYFGIEISDLIEFSPDTKKYSIFKILDYVENENSKLIIMKKTLGNSERYCLIYTEIEQTSYTSSNADGSFDTIDGIVSGIISVVNEENSVANLDEFVDVSKVIPSDVFLRDFKRQNKNVKTETTRIIADILVNNEPLNKLPKLSYIELTWTDFPFFERITFDFDIDEFEGKYNLIPKNRPL